MMTALAADDGLPVAALVPLFVLGLAFVVYCLYDMSAMIVEATALAKRYGPHTALDGVDLRVPAGSVYGLVGPNGAGKTTLLGILAGLRHASSGTVHISAPRRRIAMLPDTPQFDPWLTGREVVLLAARLVAEPAARHVLSERVDAVLTDSGLSEHAKRRVGGYSRGMLQRLGKRGDRRRGT